MLHCGCPSTYSEHAITIEDAGGAAEDEYGAEETGGADEYGADEAGGADEYGADEAGGAADEQSADANGIGTVSVAPASVIRVVVHPHVGIGAPE